MSARAAVSRTAAPDAGAASAMVLAVLVGLSALFAATAAYVELGTAEVRRARSRDAEEARLTELASAAVALLLEDPTPEADSPFDPVWSGVLPVGESRGAEIRLSQAPAGYSVALEDLSSRIGINWVRKEVLADLGALKPGVAAEELQQYREDSGLHLDPGSYERFVAAPDLEALFTTYGWFNLNISDEFALRKAALARTSDLALAEDLRGRVQQARMRKSPEEPLRLIGSDEIAGFLGPAYGQLHPIVGADPAMNVHFVPERIVEALFRHYNADKTAGEQILADRAGHEIDAERLNGLLGEAAENTPLAHYLGVRTWFWRIAVAGPSLRLTWVLARMPEDGATKLRVVEEQWEAR